MKDKLYKIGLSIGFGEGADRLDTVRLSDLVDLAVDLNEAEIETIMYEHVHEWSANYIDSWFQEVSLDHEVSN
jgi:energy-coupling factor transporter ATP-binding protein EcfA2